jgi:hypothetical protein
MPNRLVQGSNATRIAASSAIQITRLRHQQFRRFNHGSITFVDHATREAITVAAWHIKILISLYWPAVNLKSQFSNHEHAANKSLSMNNPVKSSNMAPLGKHSLSHRTLAIRRRCSEDGARDRLAWIFILYFENVRETFRIFQGEQSMSSAVPFFRGRRRRPHLCLQGKYQKGCRISTFYSEPIVVNFSVGEVKTVHDSKHPDLLGVPGHVDMPRTRGYSREEFTVNK